MASDQNQNQTASGSQPAPTLENLNEKRLREKIEAGRKIAEQSEDGENKKAVVPPEIKKVEMPASVPPPETVPAPDDPLAAMREAQRQKAGEAIEQQGQAETELAEIKEDVGDAQKEAERDARKVIDNARLTELRTERDSGRSIESARTAEVQARKVENATEDLAKSAKDARKQENVVEAAAAKAKIEIAKVKKLDAYNQKLALARERSKGNGDR